MHMQAHRFPLQGTPIRYHRCCQKEEDDDFNDTYETSFTCSGLGAPLFFLNLLLPLFTFICLSFSPFHFQQMLCRATVKESKGFYEKFQGSVRNMNTEAQALSICSIQLRVGYKKKHLPATVKILA